MSMTKDEVIRIRNLGCGNEWPKVWNRQLDELCEVYLEHLEQRAPAPRQMSPEDVREAAARVCEEHVAHWRGLQAENERLGHSESANAFRIQANTAESHAIAIRALPLCATAATEPSDPTSMTAQSGELGG